MPAEGIAVATAEGRRLARAVADGDDDGGADDGDDAGLAQPVSRHRQSNETTRSNRMGSPPDRL